MGRDQLLLVNQTQSGDGKYSVTKADMGGKIQWSAHTNGYVLVFVSSLSLFGVFIDTAGLGPERTYQQWDVLHAIRHHLLSSDSMIQ